MCRPIYWIQIDARQTNDMIQQPDMSASMIRLADVSMEPNPNGLFTIGQVAVLASKRGCNTRRVDDYGCTVHRGGKPVKIMVTDRGLVRGRRSVKFE